MGEEIARLPINEISRGQESMTMKEVSLDLKKGDDIAIWSDMDIAYAGDVMIQFRIEVLKNNEALVNQDFDPRQKSITLGEVKTSFNGKVEWSFSGKNTELSIPADATYTFKAILMASDNPTLEVRKAEIVLKH